MKDVEAGGRKRIGLLMIRLVAVVVVVVGICPHPRTYATQLEDTKMTISITTQHNTQTQPAGRDTSSALIIFHCY